MKCSCSKQTRNEGTLKEMLETERERERYLTFSRTFKSIEIASKNILHTPTDKRKKLSNLYCLQQKTLTDCCGSTGMLWVCLLWHHWVRVLCVFLYRHLESAISEFTCWSQFMSLRRVIADPVQANGNWIAMILSVVPLLFIFTPKHSWHHWDVLMVIDFGIDTLHLKTFTEIR